MPGKRWNSQGARAASAKGHAARKAKERAARAPQCLRTGESHLSLDWRARRDAPASLHFLSRLSFLLFEEPQRSIEYIRLRIWEVADHILPWEQKLTVRTGVDGMMVWRLLLPHMQFLPDTRSARQQP
jgi:hypothetical protein